MELSHLFASRDVVQQWSRDSDANSDANADCNRHWQCRMCCLRFATTAHHQWNARQEISGRKDVVPSRPTTPVGRVAFAALALGGDSFWYNDWLINVACFAVERRSTGNPLRVQQDRTLDKQLCLHLRSQGLRSPDKPSRSAVGAS